MDHDEFVKRIQETAALDSAEQAGAALEATLGTMGELLSPMERRHLAAQLRKPMKEYVDKWVERPPRNLTRPHHRFRLEEFYQRVAARSGLGYLVAIKSSRAVIRVLREAVSEGELADLLLSYPAVPRASPAQRPPRVQSKRICHGGGQAISPTTAAMRHEWRAVPSLPSCLLKRASRAEERTTPCPSSPCWRCEERGSCLHGRRNRQEDDARKAGIEPEMSKTPWNSLTNTGRLQGVLYIAGGNELDERIPQNTLVINPRISRIS
jgi:uncharacterized protein (DUF2267 family)